MKRVTLYRILIWLPLAVPALIALPAYGLGLVPSRPSAGTFFQLQFLALVYGGPVYALLAAWATWWVGGRSDAEVRRVMLGAPLLMAALYAVVALLMGVVAGQVRVFAGVALLGVAASVVLGYCYVALALLVLRGWKPSGPASALIARPAESGRAHPPARPRP